MRNFINQFKRGLFEMFLQEYHKETGKGLDSRFDNIRYYSRYNKSPIPVYLIVHDGVYFSGNDLIEPKIAINSHSQDIIDEYGFYDFHLFGHTFILPVTPAATLRGGEYLTKLKREAVLPVTDNSGIYEVTSIHSILGPLNNLGKK